MKRKPVDITVIIVNWNTKALLLECLAQVSRTLDGLAHEIFVVDNASKDGSGPAVRQHYPGVHLIANAQNRGYAAACNQALKRMNGRYALLLNTDALPRKGAIKHLVEFMEANPVAGMACGQLLYPDGSLQNSVAPFPSWVTLVTNEVLMRTLFPRRYPGKRRTSGGAVEVDSCIGACMIVRKAAMDAVGLLDERYFFFFEETDWALRMRRRGWKVFFVPQAEVIHRQGQSVGPGVESRKLFYRSRYAYFKKWYPRGVAMIYPLIFMRLMGNTLLTALGVALTLGLAPELRRRLGVYLNLVAWHLKGCPHPSSITG